MTRLAIVGAGPSALAAALAAIARGIMPDIFDIAAEPPAEARALRDRLAATPLADWRAEDRAAARASSGAARGVPRKAWFGSAFAFADAALGVESGGAVPSRAFGGYSKVWGAAALAPGPGDLADWPAELRRDLAGALDRASAILPARAPDLPYGPQMAALRADAANREALAPARLAIERASCNACGMCLSGCPYGAIFDAGAHLTALERDGKLRIVRSTFVAEVGEDASGATLRGHDLGSQAPFEFRYARILLAAGPIGTTRIVMRSRALFERDVTMKDSQKILIPILRRTAPAGALDDRGVMLAGLFVDPPAPAGYAHRPHLQITGINPMLLAHLGIGPAPSKGAWRRRMLAPLLARLMVGWGGLHSDYSGSLVLRLSPGDGPFDRLHIRTRETQASAAAARAAVASFRRALAPARTHIPPIGWRVVAPGEGNHLGASLPMGGPDSAPASDLLGRPLGFTRIHAVDASVFPSVPATTLLLLSMANADRIAREVPLGD
jgi:choline dehydrogenase-like flavoprotein